MDINKELIEMKGKVKTIETRYNALIYLLEKEGLVTREEVEQKFSEIINQE